MTASFKPILDGYTPPGSARRLMGTDQVGAGDVLSRSGVSKTGPEGHEDVPAGTLDLRPDCVWRGQLRWRRRISFRPL